MKHIRITKQVIEGSEVNSVLARDLYDSLGLDNTQFTRWSKKNILQSEFATDHIDYEGVDIMSKGKLITDFTLTIEFAKRLSMMARSTKGEEVRKYFVEVEKELNKNFLAELADFKHKTQALFEYTDKMGEVVTEHDKRIETLEKNIRMESWQERNLLDAKNKKVYELAGDDKKLANSLHRKVWSLFKKRFHLPRYSELKSGQYEKGLDYIYGLTLSDMVD